jgi:cytochrome b6-f complex iron-sulfur subunit
MERTDESALPGLPELPDLRTDLSRRNALKLAMIGAVAIGCGSALARAADPAPEPTGKVDGGDAASYPEGLSDKLLPQGIIVIRKGNKLVAASGTCTHRKCAVKLIEGQPRCPCHGSRYDAEGKVTKGPASKPLPRYAVSIEAGKLTIDASQRFEEADWGNPKASVTLP